MRFNGKCGKCAHSVCNKIKEEFFSNILQRGNNSLVIFSLYFYTYDMHTFLHNELFTLLKIQ